MDNVSQTVKAVLHRCGFDHFGWAELSRPLTMSVYEDWLDKGYHGSMSYLKDHASLKASPRDLAPQARSAIVVTKPYVPHPYLSESPIKAARTALYARGRDYHLSLRDELLAAATALHAQFPEHEFLCFTDSAPVLERDLAQRAGLGWVGKNTCVIHPQKGSLFFIGEIFTSLEFATPRPSIHDACGTCDRCIRACPTQAIEQPRVLNATKCISYWTIEARSEAPEEMRAQFGDWLFGCDICQTVCPWNEKNLGREWMRELSAQPQKNSSSKEELLQDLRWILQSSNKQLSKALHDSPLLRARPNGLKRNAIQVIGNLKIQELRTEVQAAYEVPALHEIAKWTLDQLAK